MEHADPDLLVSIAIGTGDEDRATREHLAACPRCQSDLARLRHVTETARQSRPHPGLRLQAPPERVWREVLSVIDHDSRTPDARPPASHRSRWWRRPVLIGAACAVLGAGAAVAIGQLAGSAPGRASVIARTRLNPLPEFPQWRSASATAVLARRPGGMTVSVRLTAPPRPGYYEVWLLGRDGVSMIPLGNLSRAHTGQFTLPPGVNLVFYSRLDISLQPYNGSTVHVKSSVVRGSL